jgi:putative endopeptidase
MLQAPMFDADADAASNFGAIGYVIGHEITHGFDQAGAQFDANGNLSNWWTPQDDLHFAELNDAVAAQYSSIEVLDGMFVDGELTVAENVADLGGVQAAFDALQVRLAAGEVPGATQVTDGILTPEQRFFVAAASLWRAETREASLQSQLLVDTHAPAEVRAIQPLRNCDAFHEAFDIGPGEPMYLAPGDRIVIW